MDQGIDEEVRRLDSHRLLLTPDTAPRALSISSVGTRGPHPSDYCPLRLSLPSPSALQGLFD